MLSVEEYLSSLYPTSRIKKLKEDLEYPGPVGKSLLATVFDVFYGSNIISKTTQHETPILSWKAFDRK